MAVAWSCTISILDWRLALVAFAPIPDNAPIAKAPPVTSRNFINPLAGIAETCSQTTAALFESSIHDGALMMAVVAR